MGFDDFSSKPNFAFVHIVKPPKHPNRPTDNVEIRWVALHEHVKYVKQEKFGVIWTMKKLVFTFKYTARNVVWMKLAMIKHYKITPFILWKRPRRLQQKIAFLENRERRTDLRFEGKRGSVPFVNIQCRVGNICTEDFNEVYIFTSFQYHQSGQR